MIYLYVMEVPERIKKLEEDLNSRKGQTAPPIVEHELAQKEFDVNDNWKEEDLKVSPPQATSKGGGKFYFWILLFSIVFFIGAGVYAYFSLTQGIHDISAENIDMQISGPVSIAGGEKLSLDVSITNKNKVPLKIAELIVEYPQGTRSGTDSSVSLPTERITIGDMEPGDTSHHEIQAILFGEEQSVSKIKMILEYRLPNSTSIYEKELEYEITLNSNPISLSVEAPNETISGQTINLVVNVTSNATEKMRNVIVEGEFPSGFSFIKSEPIPGESNEFWKLGEFEPGQSKKITISGTLSGENQDARTFRFNAGIGNDKNPDHIETAFAGFKQEIAISKPFLSVNVLVNGKKESDVSVKPGDTVEVEVGYVNNLSLTLRDVQILMSLSGSALDEQSITASQGFYQSNTNTVIWNKETLPDLESIAPGSSGVLVFTMTPKVNAGASNPDIRMSVGVNAIRGDDSNTLDKFTNISQKRILIQSNVSLRAQTGYESGPIDNIGGVPPKAEKETTYTVTWNLANGANDIAGAKVSATLPSYVKFTDVILPKNEVVTFNQTSNTVVWDVGVLSAGAGTSRSGRSVSFQVAITPSISQIGQAPVLVNQSVFTGEDRFGKVKINIQANPLTTLLTEPQFRSGQEIVVAQ